MKTMMKEKDKHEDVKEDNKTIKCGEGSKKMMNFQNMFEPI